MKEWLVLKIVDELDYLSCKIKLSDNNKKAWLGQPFLVESLEKKFVEQVMKVWTHKTPGMFLIVRLINKTAKIPLGTRNCNGTLA